MGINADGARRKYRRTRTIAPEARCQQCGGATALSKRMEGYLCYRCLRTNAGKRPDEAHHLFGQAEHPTVLRMEANLHRVLEDAKYTWPALVKDQTVPLPFRLLLMFLLTLRDLGSILLVFGQLFVEWLIDLVTRLRAHHGPHWDQALGLRPFHAGV